jgi:hypothetical protein
MTSILVIQESHDLTNDQVTGDLVFDRRYAHACDIVVPNRESLYARPKTCYNFHMKTNSSGMIERIFDANLLSLMDKFNVNARCQRLDSARIKNDMRQGAGPAGRDRHKVS